MAKETAELSQQVIQQRRREKIHRDHQAIIGKRPGVAASTGTATETRVCHICGAAYNSRVGMFTPHSDCVRTAAERRVKAIHGITHIEKIKAEE